MPRLLISAAACALLMGQSAFAQSGGSSVTPSQLEQSGLTAPTVPSQGVATGEADVLATQLLGQTIFTSIDDAAEEIGTVANLVITSGLGISAVVISVGGFLGVGSKDVAIDFRQLQWAQREDGSRRWVLDATAETLAAAPAFIWGESEQATGEPALTPAQEEQQLVEGDPNAVPVNPDLTTDQPESQGGAPPLDRSGFAPLDESGLSAGELAGIGVYGINDELIGTIGDVLINQDGSFDAVIVDVGGFLGLGAKPVAVGFDNLAFAADTFGSRYLFLNASREQLEAQPEYNGETYAAERDIQRMVIAP
ncbi:MAG: PRC-barrel domain containing protein [Devosia sp.]|nr:PRC-barrel domain containing protein [Devosia sp.]